MNKILLDKLNGKPTSRPPVWLMRQAGRYMESYQKIRKGRNFLDLIKNPELASDITLQPVRELNVDAGILFSDILTIPEAMGMKLIFDENGPYFPEPLSENFHLVEKLKKPNQADLNFVYETIKMTRPLLSKTFIGFAGAPLTLFAYMTEGKSTPNFSKTKKFIYNNPEISKQLLDLIADALVEYCNQQIISGVDTIQLFDSWALHFDTNLYTQFALEPTLKVIDSIKAPVTMFARGYNYKSYLNSNAKALGIDWCCNLSEAAKDCIDFNKCFQGNLDPSLLLLDWPKLEPIVERNIKEMEQFRNHWIVNLGHGVIKESKQDTVLKLVQKFQTWNP